MIQNPIKGPKLLPLQFHFLLLLDGEILSLKTHALEVEHKETELELTQKLSPRYPAFIFLEGDRYSVEKSFQWLYPLMDPSYYSTGLPGKMY